MSEDNPKETKLLSYVNGVYIGDRGEKFKTLIIDTLKRSRIKPDMIEKLTTKANLLSVYSNVFTAKIIDEKNNYEVYEQLGDACCNHFIVKYFYVRFPQLNTPDGVKVVARLKINYCSKNTFYGFAKKMGFWDYITCSHDLRQRLMKSLLEDVFEAFIGATEMLIDQMTNHQGIGYTVMYRLLQSVYDELDISLDYETLYDSKTRLREVFDMYKSKDEEKNIGIVEYTEEIKDLTHICTVYRLKGGKRFIIGQGSAPTKAEAEKRGASDAIQNLEKQGFKKFAPKIYKQLQENESFEDTVEKIQVEMTKFSQDIDSPQPTKKINMFNYNNEYRSPLVHMYCRRKSLIGVEECIIKHADVSLLDSDGMTCLDLLFMGKYEINLTEDHDLTKITKILIKKGCTTIHRIIYDQYFIKYPILKIQGKKLNIID